MFQCVINYLILFSTVAFVAVPEPALASKYQAQVVSNGLPVLGTRVSLIAEQGNEIKSLSPLNYSGRAYL